MHRVRQAQGSHLQPFRVEIDACRYHRGILAHLMSPVMKGKIVHMPPLARAVPVFKVDGAGIACHAGKWRKAGARAIMQARLRIEQTVRLSGCLA